MRAAGLFAVVAVALALQTTVTRGVGGATPVVDVVLVAVVYAGLTGGPVAGLLTGSVAGIAQDALSSGVIGVGGLAKSLVGFAVGVVGQQFIVAAAFPRIVTFIGATAAHAGLFVGLYVALGLRTFQSEGVAVATQMAGNAVVGMMAMTVVESFPGMLERRRLRRKPRL